MSESPMLNEEQQEAVTYGDGPMLIIAGAGTGKTTVVTERIKYLILEKNIMPSEMLALTFTEKAAREMEQRVDIALPYGYTQMWIATFHAFCDRILRQEAIHIGLNPGYRLTSDAETMLFLRKNLYRFELEYFRPLGNPYKFLQGMVQHFARLKDDDITPDDYKVYAEKLALDANADPDDVKKTLELSRAYKVYEDLKAEEGIMDFSDLISNVLKLFRKRKNLLTYYQNKFKYILVDEFQDTNYAQNELAILLAGEKQNINVVGDDDQAIYRWRGAALANMIQFREHFPRAKIVTLIKNYRSCTEVLESAYQLIQYNNPERLEVKEKINKKLIAIRGRKDSPVEFLFAPRVEGEADQVVEKITELIKKKKYTFKDFAILVRANDHAQPFIRALERIGIPYQFLGPGHLFHQEEIKDLIAYLKVMVNFEDSTAMYRVLCMPIFNFDARDIAAILNYAKRKNFTLFEALEQIDDTFMKDDIKERITKIVTMIHTHLKRVPKETAGQVLYYFFEDSGLLRTFINPDNPMTEKKAQNVAKFFEKLKSYEAEHDDASVFHVIDWIDLSMQLGESPLAADVDWIDNNAVNILTVHSSKGLEFPVVFVVNLVTQRFPTRDRREQIPIPEDLIREELPEDSDQNLSEERRLCYVAMTRARDYLFLTAANYYGEGKRERKLSPFIAEALGEDYIRKILDKKKLESSVKQLSLLDVLQKVQPPEVSDDFAVNTNKESPYPVNYISYSQIDTFETCPLHYKLKYILKIPPFPHPSLSFGTSVHCFLRDYFQHLMQEKTPDFQSLLKQNWINEGYQSKSHEKNAYLHAEKILQKYITKNGNSLPLATEIPFMFTIPGLKIGGRIDRVDKMDDGRIEIIDYKTGSTMPKEKDLDKQLQLTVYAMAATSVKDSIFSKSHEEIVLSLYYLETDTKLSTVRTKEQLDEAQEFLRRKAVEISQSEFHCKGGIACKNCEYKLICQTYAN